MSAQLIIGFIFFLLTWLVARYYYRKGLKVYKLTPYLISLAKVNINLNDSFKENLKIKYKGINIGHLYQVQFYIINTGNTVIKTFEKPLTLEIPNEGKIAGVNIPYKTKQIREIFYKIVKKSENQFIEFDIPFLEKNEAFIISVLIEGTVEKDQWFFFNISSPGIPSEIRASKLPKKEDLKKTYNLYIIESIMGLFSLVMCILILLYPEWQIQNKALSQLFLLIIGGMIGLGLAAFERLIKDFNSNRFYKKLFSFIPSEYLRES